MLEQLTRSVWSARRIRLLDGQVVADTRPVAGTGAVR
jgi:hypothetical protein